MSTFNVVLPQFMVNMISRGLLQDWNDVEVMWSPAVWFAVKIIKKVIWECVRKIKIAADSENFQRTWPPIQVQFN